MTCSLPIATNQNTNCHFITTPREFSQKTQCQSVSQLLAHSRLTKEKRQEMAAWKSEEKRSEQGKKKGKSLLNAYQPFFYHGNGMKNVFSIP